MRRGRRYDVPTIIERNAIEERSFRIQLSYKTHDDEQCLFDPRDEQRYNVCQRRRAILHAGLTVM